jgi:threonine aldolase
VHFPRTRLICLENTQGTIGGVPISAAYTAQVAEIAREHQLRLHIDGARIFNAAVALNTSAKDLVRDADSVMFCLSKGLCAPVGSMLVGSYDFIQQARRVRKSLGGGMRQAGILAAAGLIAIRSMTTRLAEDHVNAYALAEELVALPHIHLDLKTVQTNMVFFDLAEDAPITPEVLTEQLREKYHILMQPYPAYRYTFRAVTHYWITREQIYQTVAALRELLTA